MKSNSISPSLLACLSAFILVSTGWTQEDANSKDPIHFFSAHVRVFATNDWTPPLTIPAHSDGQERPVKIKASGSWTGDKNRSPNGPGGNGVTAHNPYALTGVPEWCLLVHVTSPDDPQGPVMPFWKDGDVLVVNSPCTLSFRINDSPNLGDNAGSLDVSINEEPSLLDLYHQSQSPVGPTQSYVDGTLVKGSSAKVYVILNGRRHWIPNEATFNARGYDWSKILWLTDNVVDAIPEGDPLRPNHRR